MKILITLSMLLMSVSAFSAPKCWEDESSVDLVDGSFIVMSSSYEDIALNSVSEFNVGKKLKFINAVVLNAYVGEGETREEAKERTEIALQIIEDTYLDAIIECNQISIGFPALTGRN